MENYEKQNNNIKYDLVVIGGGPSGMMMAGRAAELGARVLLIERNKKLGEKLKMTGGGRCNITNAEFNNKKFLENFPKAKNFLYSPFSKFSVKDTFTFFEKYNLPLVTEARNRVFPKSQEAYDVFIALEKYLEKGGVEVKTRTRVVSIKKEDEKIVSITTKKGEEIFARNFAIATGGLAAPETGSTGDGFRFLKKLDHSVKEPNPNVVPLTTNATWVHRLSGNTLSFMKIKFTQRGKIKIKKIGKILFTHFGVSGPLILNTSYEVTQLLKKGKVTASIDIFPDTEENILNKRILKLFEQNKNRKLRNVLPELIPEKLSKEILNMPDMDMNDLTINSITKEDRKVLVKRLKNLSFPITGTLGFKKAVIVDGGIQLEEVDFKNMTSRNYPNLYLLGDVLDINRPSGGFSLQLCWTTGWVAGSDIGEKIN
ncbi:NAD(P)/FAD-dependent oxidoreductase [Patescibacteria group bacterium]